MSMGESAIQLVDMRFRWQQHGQLVLNIPELTISAGERVLIKGASGSGKTTLLNLLGGVAIPESGALKVLGTNLTSLTSVQRDKFRADQIGFVFQMFNLIPYLSLTDNVLLPCRFSATRRLAALRSSERLEEEAIRLLTQMALNVAELERRPVTQLSTGQQQRVAVARSLIGSPPLIIADEPTSALDAATRHAFLDLLFHEIRATGATLVFVSHDADLGKNFDRTIALADINKAAA
jgi:putative ABC transport system ATP-binding protein